MGSNGAMQPPAASGLGMLNSQGTMIRPDLASRIHGGYGQSSRQAWQVPGAALGAEFAAGGPTDRYQPHGGSNSRFWDTEAIKSDYGKWLAAVDESDRDGSNRGGTWSWGGVPERIFKPIMAGFAGSSPTARTQLQNFTTPPRRGLTEAQMGMATRNAGDWYAQRAAQQADPAAVVTAINPNLLSNRVLNRMSGEQRSAYRRQNAAFAGFPEPDPGPSLDRQAYTDRFEANQRDQQQPVAPAQPAGPWLIPRNSPFVGAAGGTLSALRAPGDVLGAGRVENPGGGVGSAALAGLRGSQGWLQALSDPNNVLSIPNFDPNDVLANATGQPIAESWRHPEVRPDIWADYYGGLDFSRYGEYAPIAERYARDKIAGVAMPSGGFTGSAMQGKLPTAALLDRAVQEFMTAALPQVQGMRQYLDRSARNEGFDPLTGEWGNISDQRFQMQPFNQALDADVLRYFMEQPPTTTPGQTTQYHPTANLGGTYYGQQSPDFGPATGIFGSGAPGAQPIMPTNLPAEPAPVLPTVRDQTKSSGPQPITPDPFENVFIPVNQNVMPAAAGYQDASRAPMMVQGGQPTGIAAGGMPFTPYAQGTQYPNVTPTAVLMSQLGMLNGFGKPNTFGMVAGPSVFQVPLR